MPLTCGVTVNINNFKGLAQNQLNTFINLNLGTPDGLNALAGQLGGALSSLGSSIAGVLPPLPSIPLSLREELAALAALPLAGVAAAGKILSIAEEFADAIGLRGFVNLNLTDLSKSVFSLTGDFDPCNPSIPNILKNADGTLQKLPSISPDLGSAVAAVNNIKIQEITNNFTQAIESNIPIVTGSIETATKALQANVLPAVSGMGDSIRTLATGEKMVETREFFIKRITETRTSLLTEV
jgi:hypothetical protein|tara:strand:+ start:1460 stop:2179 length:720 start_codon:yes stop_codon:yes gene_type:complete